MNLKIILSKIVQTQKDKCCIFSVVCGPLLLMFHVCACIFRCVYVLAIFRMYVYLAGVRVCACICVHRYVCLHRSYILKGTTCERERGLKWEETKEGLPVIGRQKLGY